MGGWSDGDKVTVDWDGGERQPVPVLPEQAAVRPAKAPA
jgi:hypothetical protein